MKKEMTDTEILEILNDEDFNEEFDKENDIKVVRTEYAKMDTPKDDK